jgi:hypothetical protein
MTSGPSAKWWHYSIRISREQEREKCQLSHLTFRAVLDRVQNITDSFMPSFPHFSWRRDDPPISNHITWQQIAMSKMKWTNESKSRREKVELDITPLLNSNYIFIVLTV